MDIIYVLLFEVKLNYSHFSLAFSFFKYVCIFVTLCIYEGFYVWFWFALINLSICTF